MIRWQGSPRDMGGVAVERSGLPGVDGVLRIVDDQDHATCGVADNLHDAGLMRVAGVLLAWLETPAPHLDRSGA